MRAVRIHKKSASTHISTCVVRILTSTAKQTTTPHRAPHFYPRIRCSRQVHYRHYWRPCCCHPLLYCTICCLSVVTGAFVPCFSTPQLACCVSYENRCLRDFTLAPYNSHALVAALSFVVLFWNNRSLVAALLLLLCSFDFNF